MKKENNSIAFAKKRRFYTFLPFAVVPILTLLFWVIGSTSENKGLAQSVDSLSLNTNLPDFNSSQKEALTKMNYYDQASSDSSKLEELRKVDPYYQMNPSNDLSTPADLNKPETEIYTKLNQLNQIISQETSANQVIPKRYATPDYTSKDVKRLEQMMNDLQNGNEEDPELKQLDGMLEKIMTLQYPESYKEKLKGETNTALESIYEAIPAEIDIKQKVSPGSVVKLKITEETVINGQTIPKGHYLFGQCEIYNQRLKLRIKNIRLGNAILPVDLIVYDKNDGMEGINLPEVVIKDALRSGSDNALQGLQILPFDQSVETQIAGAGIAAAKGLFSKKLKPIRAKLDEGYPLLLKDNSKKIN